MIVFLTLTGCRKEEKIKVDIDLPMSKANNLVNHDDYNSFIGKNVSVLIEEIKEDYYVGFSDNYIPIKVKGNYKINEIYDIKLEKDNINFNLY